MKITFKLILILSLVLLSSTTLKAQSNTINLPIIVKGINQPPICNFWIQGDNRYFSLSFNDDLSKYKIYDLDNQLTIATISQNGIYTLTTKSSNLLAIRIIGDNVFFEGCKLITTDKTGCVFITSNTAIRIFVYNIRYDEFPQPDTQYIIIYKNPNEVFGMFNLVGLFDYGGNINQTAYGFFKQERKVKCVHYG